MNITMVASRETFEKALGAAKDLSLSGGLQGLAAGLDAGLLGRLDDAWDRVEEALRRCFVFGRNNAQALIDAAIEAVEAAVEQAGAKQREAHTLVLARSQQYVETLLHESIRRVPGKLSVGENVFELGMLRFAQKINASGSIKVNLTELFSLTASGEISLQADYGRLQVSRSD